MIDGIGVVTLAAMPQHISKSVLGFLFALVLGAATVPALEGMGMEKPWTIVIGWVVFLAAGTGFHQFRRQHRL